MEWYEIDAVVFVFGIDSEVEFARSHQDFVSIGSLIKLEVFTTMMRNSRNASLSKIFD